MYVLILAWVFSLLINGVLIFLAGMTETHYWYYAMFAIAATGLTTFFGIFIYSAQSAPRNEVDTQGMRLSITGLVVNSYITLLVYCLFIPENIILNQFVQSLLTNFTAVVGTVVAFFFGSAAYIEAHRTETREPQRREREIERGGGSS